MVKNQRLFNMRDLDAERRGFSPSNWAADSDEALIGKAGHGIVSDLQEELVNRNVPGAGGRFRKLGQDQAALIRAEEGLMAGGGPRLPYPSKGDVARRVAGGFAPNALATATEDAAGVARWAGRKGQALGNAVRAGADAVDLGLGRTPSPRASLVEGVDRGMLAGGYRAADQLGLAASRYTADALQGEEYVESAETPEEKALRDFQESFRNRDYGLTR
jgi:hypothetical protein